ncbi:hypothetical protein CDAR_261831 [Caerostris darwini]|uniref:Uncharacterized protein n=1 Tax=Caerostris darwini TaxID=1538125 RepID=A0AAV4V0Y6_9ARAC|nr:hypothetical protein CDAR_261831 [Caerostris darwini]
MYFVIPFPPNPPHHVQSYVSFSYVPYDGCTHDDAIFNPSQELQRLAMLPLLLQKTVTRSFHNQDADDPLPYQSIFFHTPLSVCLTNLRTHIFFSPLLSKRRGRDGGRFAKGVRTINHEQRRILILPTGIFCLSTDDVVLKVPCFWEKGAC